MHRVRRARDANSGKSAYYDVYTSRPIDSHQTSYQGEGIIDVAKKVSSKVVSKLTGKVAKDLATKAATKALEKGVEKDGEKTGKLIGEKIYDKFCKGKQESKGDQIIQLLQTDANNKKTIKHPSEDPQTNKYDALTQEVIKLLYV